jgi:arylsulfatase A-like enzyme
MNVIIFTIDSLRYDRCSVNGHSRVTTPNHCWLTDGRIVFDIAHATGPFTADARQLSNRFTPDHHVRYDYVKQT